VKSRENFIAKTENQRGKNLHREKQRTNDGRIYALDAGLLERRAQEDGGAT
jgi:hypothetical protein